jgi:hypothetical protein
VTLPAGWRSLRDPSKREGAAAFVPSRFGRLARVHLTAIASDALVAVALAGTLFFSIPTGEARGRVALYLLLTMAPFAVVAPLIGPLLDRMRGGRRAMVVATAAVRMIVCIFMVGDVDSLLLFPEAFVVLVASKTYHVAKSALVPTVVDNDEELVLANSRLQLLSGIGGVLAALPGLALNEWVGAGATLVAAAAVSALSGLAALRLPAEPVASEPAGPVEEAELRSAGIVLGASAMGVLRGIVGFVTFLLAFDLRGGGDDGPIPVGLAFGRAVRVAAGFDPAGTGSASGAPTWHFGVVLAMSVLGGVIGSVAAPYLRRALDEERMLAAALVGTALAAVLAAGRGGLFGAGLVGLAVALAATIGKQAFDAIVQRDAPDANRGRSFAQFEARFQLIWVVGGFLPVIVPIPARLGFLVVAAAAGFALFSYVAGSRAARQAAAARARPPVAA